MDRDLALKLIEEIKKIRNDMDSVKAYTLTMAEQITIIAQNTAPADATPSGGET